MPDPTSNTNATPPIPPGTMPVFHTQNGTLGAVPTDKFAETVTTPGYEPAVAITAPDGVMGYVPRSKVKDTLAQPGYTMGNRWSEKSFAPPAESGSVLTDLATAGKNALTGLKHLAFYEPAKGESPANSGPELQIAGTMAKAGQQAVEQHKRGQNARAIVSGAAAINPFAAGPVANINTLEDQGKPREALTNGVLDAGLLALGSETARNTAGGLLSDTVDATRKTASKVPDAITAAMTKTPDQVLWYAVRPKNSAQFAADTRVAVPRVARAAANLGQPIRTAQDALTAVTQAKTDLLLDAADQAGGALTDLSPEDAANVTRQMDSLNRFETEIRNAKLKEDAARTRESSTESFLPAPLRFISSRVSKVTSKLDPAIEQVFAPLAPDTTAISTNRVLQLAKEFPLTPPPPETSPIDLSVTPAAPPPTRVPLWKQAGVTAGKPPVQTPQRLAPATPRAQRAQLLQDLDKLGVLPQDMGGIADSFSPASPSPIGRRATPAAKQGGVTLATPPDTSSTIVPGQWTFGRSTPLNGESAAREFLASQNIGWLKSKAAARGIAFNGAEDARTLGPKLISNLLDSLTPEEIDAFESVQQSSQPALNRPLPKKARTASPAQPAATEGDLGDLLQRSIEAVQRQKSSSVPSPIAEAIAAQPSGVPEIIEQLTASGHTPTSGVASLEELTRGGGGLNHWRVNVRSGQLGTHLGVQPDPGPAGLRPGEAIISLSRDGKVGVAANASGLSDSEVVSKFEPVLRRTFPDKFKSPQAPNVQPSGSTPPKLIGEN